ncbi:MAG: hypothetical protein GAK30_01573 [Paracidovorax wautersii]|uniref:Phage Tail Collar Domain n=1 Tax=Paracidovorax wautersii TaxID=1177982 RepID=A0A7V8FPQ7_9BURK|nr:MAG: hypothetical protein GAK30_01573 [Paracidovorax wautersii]
MAFSSIHTTAGLREIARAQATGSTITLVSMVLGDGGGNSVDPSVDMTQLVRERWRGAINRIYQSPDDETQYIAEAVVPADDGGWWIREGGLIDSNGNLYTVCNLPDSYKPLPTEGTASDITQRIVFQPGNAQTVALQIDPNVTIATLGWVTNYATAANIIPGGTTGQLLKKHSNADGDTEWGDPDDIEVTVDTIEEAQTLADGQTIVDLTVTTTRGLALYADGVRLRADQWTKDPDLSTRLTLAAAWPAGTKLIAAQNEPTGNAPDPLVRSKNLSDLDNAATARTNLGVYSKAESDRAGPIGMPSHWPTANIPTGWLIRNGAAISRTAYAALFAVLGTTYGAGDGFNTFNLPDDRALFDGNADLGRGKDTAMAVGTTLDSQNKAHTHTGTTESAGDHFHNVRRGSTNAQGNASQSGEEISTSSRFMTSFNTDSAGSHSHSFTTASSGGTHARPNTRAYVPIIRAL